LRDQTPERVHDLRTAARRLLAVIELLPKSVRNEKRVRKYSIRIQKLINVNAKVRDLDIIITRVALRKNVFEYAKLAKTLENTRQTSLKPVVDSVSSFSESKQPSVHARDLSNADARKRYNKTTKRLSSTISKRLPIVLQDASNKRELHKLREDSRMLRYTIELSLEKKSLTILPILRSWQETLGLIHDSDIVIDYLQNEDESPEVRDLIRDERTERNKNYERFASIAAKSAPKLDQ